METSAERMESLQLRTLLCIVWYISHIGVFAFMALPVKAAGSSGPSEPQASRVCQIQKKSWAAVPQCQCRIVATFQSDQRATVRLPILSSVSGFRLLGLRLIVLCGFDSNGVFVNEPINRHLRVHQPQLTQSKLMRCRSDPTPCSPECNRISLRTSISVRNDEHANLLHMCAISLCFDKNACISFGVCSDAIGTNAPSRYVCSIRSQHKRHR
jgi:hypothetical protein